ncbi:MAG: hypothetical protein V1848_02260 [Candidatus Magasanikbacteria bacterium]
MPSILQLVAFLLIGACTLFSSAIFAAYLAYQNPTKEEIVKNIIFVLLGNFTSFLVVYLILTAGHPHPIPSKYFLYSLAGPALWILGTLCFYIYEKIKSIPPTE